MGQKIGDINNSSVFGANINADTNIEKKVGIQYGYFIFMFLNIAFLCVNIYYTCCLFPHNYDVLSFDYSGIIVGIFSLLITILIGWQIYSMINLNKVEKEIEYKITSITEEKQEQIQKEIKKNMERAIRASTLVSLSQIGLCFYHEPASSKDGSGTDKFGDAIRSFFNAQAIWHNSSSIEELAEEADKQSYIYLKNLTKKMKGELYVDSFEEKKFFLDTAIKIDDEDIIRFASNIKVKDKNDY